MIKGRKKNRHIYIDIDIVFVTFFRYLISFLYICYMCYFVFKIETIFGRKQKSVQKVESGRAIGLGFLLSHFAFCFQYLQQKRTIKGWISFY